MAARTSSAPRGNMKTVLAILQQVITTLALIAVAIIGVAAARHALSAL